MTVGGLGAAALDWLEPWWDPDVALLWNPEGAYRELGPAKTVHLVPHSGWYAAGLLLRDAPGDRRRAEATIDALCAIQYRAPGQPWDGTFAQFLEWPVPEPGAIEWLHYDPNWRQFIGTTFTVLLALGLVDGKRAQRMSDAIRAAVAGEPPGRVPPSYTNIALMRAFVEVEYGDRAAAERYAESVVSLFDAHGAFAEYNSPTYYGIDLFALGLWRRMSSSPRLREEGARIEAALWRDIARWYHADLSNLCGPFSRAYGMDMRSYASLLGMCIGAATGGAHVPLPDLQSEFDHSHDIAMAPLVEWLGFDVPADAQPHLTSFGGDRAVEQAVPVGATATGWLEPGLMIGAAAGAPFPARGQFHPATVHWPAPAGCGWLRVCHDAPIDAVARRRRLEVKTGAAGTATVVVHVPGATKEEMAGAFSGPTWNLPGLTVGLEADGDGPAVEADEGMAKVRLPSLRHLTLSLDPA